MKTKPLLITIVMLFILTNAAIHAAQPEGKTKMTDRPETLDITANITFFYYKDLDKAVEFYEKTMGLERILDYGFAKAYRVSHSTILCLVDETKGMHKTTEPKTVTIAFMTKNIDEWYHYLHGQGVKTRNPVRNSKRLPIRGFIAYDPGGYYLEFSSFFKKNMNKKLVAQLDQYKQVYPIETYKGPRHKNLGIHGNILFLYYKDIPEAQKFYEENLGLKLMVDQGYAKIYGSSATGFIGLVDQAEGLHRFTREKAVNVGFITKNVDGWYKRLKGKNLKMRGPLKNAEKSRVRAFVTYDPAGYYLEFDTFIPHKSNKVLMDLIGKLK